MARSTSGRAGFSGTRLAPHAGTHATADPAGTRSTYDESPGKRAIDPEVAPHVEPPDAEAILAACNEAGTGIYVVTLGTDGRPWLGYVNLAATEITGHRAGPLKDGEAPPFLPFDAVEPLRRWLAGSVDDLRMIDQTTSLDAAGAMSVVAKPIKARYHGNRALVVLLTRSPRRGAAHRSGEAGTASGSPSRVGIRSARMPGLLRTLPVGIFRTDPDGRILAGNPALLRMLACPDLNTLRRFRVEDLYVDPTARGRLLREVDHAEGGVEFDAQFKRLDGEVRWARGCSQAVRDGNGRVVSYHGFVQDVTERKEMEHAIAVQRAYLGAVIDAAPAMVYAKDAEGRFTLVNKRLAEAYGVEPSQMIGRTFYEFDRDGEQARRLQDEDEIARARDGGPHGKEETRIDPASGAVRHFHTVRARFEPPGGGPPQVLAVATDVTEQKRAERAYTEQTERLAAVLSGAPIVLFSLDEAGRFTMLEGRGLEGLGIMPRDVRGVALLDNPGVPAELADSVRRAMGGRRANCIVHHDDHVFEVQCRPKLDGEGRPQGVIGLAVDVTDVVRLEEERHQAEESRMQVQQLQEINRFKVQLLNRAAHELNTPLTPLKVRLELLAAGRYGTLSGEQNDVVNSLERNLERLERVVGALLDVANIEHGRLRLDKLERPAQPVIDEVIASFVPVAEGAGVRLYRGLTTEETAVVDADRIAQALCHLVENAIDATGDGGQVWVDVECVDDMLAVHVRDTGRGLTADAAARLFSRFAPDIEADEEIPRGSGLGLGLYTCKRIVEAHMGRVWCSSPGPGQGATFSFAVPLDG